MNNINVRDCTPEDRAFFLRLMEQVHTLHHNNRPDIYRPAEQKLLEDYFDEVWENEATQILIGLYEDQPAAICVLAFRTPSPKNPVLVPRKVGYIDDFCVDDRLRGKGIGRELFAEAQRRCEAAGMDRMELMVWDFNQAAMRFYEGMEMNEKYRVLEKKL